MLPILLSGCATDQFEVELTNEILEPTILYQVKGFHSCPLSEADIDLLIAIEKGAVEPNVSIIGHDRVALSAQSMNTWRARKNSLEGYFPPLVIDKKNTKPVFVAVFDGTWNDRDDLDSFLTIPAKLSYELEKLSENNKHIIVKYYNGVGTKVFLFRALADGITGQGTIKRAELALKDLQKAEQEIGEMPNIYVIGFSRGAASARHFLNLVDPILHMPSGFSELNFDRSRSFALLFDTVATGQLDKLKLEIPISTVSALHLVATEERRINFPYVTVLSDTNSETDLNQVIELKLPGAHSNLGGGYGSGLEIVSFDIAKRWLIEQGFALSGKEADTLAVLNQGRHDSDWLFTSFAHGLLKLLGKSERQSIEPISIDSRLLTPEQETTLLFEKSTLIIKSATARLERLDDPINIEETIQKKTLSLQFSRKNDLLLIETNCPEYVSFNSKKRMLELKDFNFFSMHEIYKELKTTPGILHLIEAETPSNYRKMKL
jgi:hypothetical protein